MIDLEHRGKAIDLKKLSKEEIINYIIDNLETERDYKISIEVLK